MIMQLRWSALTVSSLPLRTSSGRRSYRSRRRPIRYNPNAMISVTAKSRYAVVGMAELARNSGKPVPIATVAERRDIPVQFLEQLFSTLRRAGLLVSQRGVKGGYRLARDADQITVLEVVQALDGKLGEEGREAGGIWADGVTSLRSVFERATIADVARREEAESGGGMYFI
jgi:Rrf2 family protein